MATKRKLLIIFVVIAVVLIAALVNIQAHEKGATKNHKNTTATPTPSLKPYGVPLPEMYEIKIKSVSTTASERPS